MASTELLPQSRRDVANGARGVERLLRCAAVDEQFCRELVAHRDVAASAAGVDLSPSEAAILRAIPAPQLVAMVERMPPPPQPRREFLHRAAATAVVLLGGVALGRGASGCHRQEPPAAEPPRKLSPEEIEQREARRKLLLERAKEEEAKLQSAEEVEVGEDEGYGYEWHDPLVAGGHMTDVPAPKKKPSGDEPKDEQ